MNTVVELDLQLLSFTAGTVIPLLVAVLTKLNASQRTKAVLNLVLSVIVGTVAYLVEQNGRFTWYELLTAMATVYLASGVTYQNLWKPTNVAPVLQLKTRDFGFGDQEIEPPVAA